MNPVKKLFRKRRVSREEYKLLLELEAKIGYKFWNTKLLKQALSHKSYVNEKRLPPLDHNERLEYLGDAVLELGISDMLMHYFSNSREGEMSKLRASIVNETALSEVARRLDLGKYLFLGKGEEQCDGREKNSLLADAVEAVLGAIYLDSDFPQVFRILKLLFLPVVMRATKEDINRDYKTKLQEEVHTKFRLSPQYKLVNEIGPDHDKTFEIHLYLSGKKIGEGLGKSKKQAEQSAAHNALEALKTSKYEGENAAM
jgi:ribonuclease III